MKTSRWFRNTRSPVVTSPGRLRNRRGTLFNYYLVYLMMTGSIMAAAGVCMHATLRSDQADTASAWQLQALRNMERMFRQDIDDADNVVLNEGQLICSIRGPNGQEIGETVVWKGEGAVVRRTVSDQGSETQRQRFVFADGAIVQFRLEESRQVVVQIQERTNHVVEILAYFDSDAATGDQVSRLTIDHDVVTDAERTTP